MKNINYQDGDFCSYKGKLCKEGYRDGCKMCMNSFEPTQKPAHNDWSKFVFESRMLDINIFSQLFDTNPLSLLSN